MLSPTIDVEPNAASPEVRWAGSMADAREAKKLMMEDFELKRHQVDIDEIDVPTDKAGLLAFLNERIRALKA
jgi:hypothetical protein